jgi:hypothetical protein
VLAGVVDQVYGYYCEIEAIASNDLMSVRGWAHARVDKRVSALNSELRACKSKHVLRGSRLRQKRSGSESFPKHGGR